MTEISDYVRALRGPIVVLGAGGFVGANLLRLLLKYRSDVFGVVRKLPAWRLEAIDRRHILEIDINDLAATRNMVTSILPATLFDCVAYGAYSFETDHALIYRTNFSSLVQLVELLAETEFTALVHAGSSSEYGLNSAGPGEDTMLQPNSHYSVSKAAASDYLSFAGKVRRLPVVNLRLYSVYGPFEDTSRLIPNLIAKGMKGEYPLSSTRTFRATLSTSMTSARHSFMRQRRSRRICTASRSISGRAIERRYATWPAFLPTPSIFRRSPILQPWLDVRGTCRTGTQPQKRRRTSSAGKRGSDFSKGSG
ncbi:NAD-dependent epimerase/dehydratase family protein [Rhodopseudomonas sp. P2A-2r]|nr:NAD-dependent epimerase/dehydratase family protein [Rhodopseudomonas sp. P2A-2r]UZE48083.1 NAD-dependent epimerase/dehydratase family protein [Rhodopseudomonas sp. P2A-2r]